MDRQNRVAAVIVAAGDGVRMGTAQKKQYAMLGSRPVLAHTMSAFDNCNVIEEIFLVIAEKDYDLCQQEIIGTLELHKPVHLVSGGASRQESVFNGLMATEGRFEILAIHDGVRPLIRIEKIIQCVKTAEKHGACILALPASDTVKTIDDEDRVVVTMKRHMIRMAQTPQAFHYNLLLGAHVAAQKEDYAGSDDAELVEMCGEVVKVISGDPGNIKITTPEDLKMAEALLGK